ncbi:MAG: nucleotidyltransferase domain-containing protein [Chloroflexia bacterium]
MKIFSPPFDREMLVEHLRRRVGELRALLPVTRVVLFGSYVRGQHTIASDVDLLVIYAGPKRDDAYALVRRTLHLPRLEPHLYTEEEYRLLRKTVDRMIADGLPIFPT